MCAYVDLPVVAARADADARATFIRRTYAHLALAIAAFVGVEIVLFQTDLPQAILQFIAANRAGWLLFIGGFMVVGWMARGLAGGGASAAAQYLGLTVFVVAEAILFTPLLCIAVYYASPVVLPSAAFMTGLLFVGLTVTAFTSRRDFSFFGSFLKIGGILALGLIVCGALFGFNLGLAFSGAMVVFASVAILYDTSRILLHFSTDRHVAASLELFASVALLFWYILNIFLRISRR